MIAPPAQMISNGSIPAASQKIRFLMIDNTMHDRLCRRNHDVSFLTSFDVDM
jgi:hypothetical protein